METVSTKKATDTSVCKKHESGRNWVQGRRNCLQLPIVVLEVSKVVPDLNEFGHIQKLGQLEIVMVEYNPVLTEFAQVPMRSTLHVKMKLSN